MRGAREGKDATMGSTKENSPADGINAPRPGSKDATLTEQNSSTSPQHLSFGWKTNPEISSVLRRQTKAEREKLEALVLRDGVQDPVVLWRETGEILDGHNRVDIASGNNKDGEVLPLKDPEYVSCDDLDSAIEYVLDRQEGRREQTRQDRSYARAQLYERRKGKQGGTGANQHTQSGHFDHSAQGKTSGEVGKNFGVGEKTIRRDAEYARAVDALAAAFGADFKSHVLSGESKLSMGDVVMLAGKLGEDDDLLRSAVELWAFGWTGTFKLALLLAEVEAGCGPETHSALWENDDENARVRESAGQLVHLKKLSKTNPDETTADLVELVEGGGAGSVFDAHKTRQKERRRARMDAARAEKLSRVRDGALCRITSDQAVVPCDAVITDPPYGILSAQKVGWDSSFHPFDGHEAFTRDWLSRVNASGADLVASFWSQRRLFEGRRWFDEELTNYEFTQMLVWVYRNNSSPQSRAMFKQTWEPIFFYRRRGSNRTVGCGGSGEGDAQGEWGGDLHDFDSHVAAVPQGNFSGSEEKVHPAQKPVSVMRWLVGALTDPGDLVADPFCGSGTTGVAALSMDRRFHGVEKDEGYLRLAEGRVAEYGLA